MPRSDAAPPLAADLELTDPVLIDPRRTWRVLDDRRLPALEPFAADVRRYGPVTVRETVWDAEDRVLAAAGVVLTRSSDGTWSIDRGPDSDGPEPLAGEPDTPPRVAVEVFLRGRALRTVLVRDTTTSLVTLRGGDGRVRAEIADVRVDDGDPDTTVLRSARWWALTVDGREGATARAAERALHDAATDPVDVPSVALPRGPEPAPERRGGRAKRPRSNTAAGFVLRVLDALRNDLVAVEPRVRNDEHEAVHDLRKVVRRLRSVLAAFRGALDRQATESLRASFAEIGRTAGTARDAEVLHAGLSRSAARTPTGYVDTETLRRIDSETAERRSTTAAELRRALDSEAWFRTLDALDDLLLRAPAGPHGDEDATVFTTRRIRHERARVGRQLGDADDDLETLHEIRKAARRLRYALQAAGDLPDVGKRRLGRLRRVQETLGETLDAAHAADAYRRSAAVAAQDGVDTFGYGALATAEHAALGQGIQRSWRVLARL
ncbi:CHAD domain-containing protein [Curtobacterium aurantiacum]|uniref:CHAD domain-containing protein n=1 Tax=Curtobacterium aurantiacum TaxID=3236919 RepID=A0ABS5VDR7_9MICO|nr:CHAD domain-containing protein [Curtobacterium flaccumfaciens]MBT1546884.1 CHAD domain-containing protein [Curtobacterium flaccumfaciens pv. flaccumfaciens]MBT1587644.1 CHAD domain-containing protein [Curtobacterium flaccumfaciens pv. flaccumfaciens]